jgi:hypothetical protein
MSEVVLQFAIVGFMLWWFATRLEGKMDDSFIAFAIEDYMRRVNREIAQSITEFISGEKERDRQLTMLRYEEDRAQTLRDERLISNPPALVFTPTIFECESKLEIFEPKYLDPAPLPINSGSTMALSEGRVYFDTNGNPRGVRIGNRILPNARLSFAAELYGGQVTPDSPLEFDIESLPNPFDVGIADLEIRNCYTHAYDRAEITCGY